MFWIRVLTSCDESHDDVADNSMSLQELSNFMIKLRNTSSVAVCRIIFILYFSSVPGSFRLQTFRIKTVNFLPLFHPLPWFIAQSHQLTHLHHFPYFIAHLHHLAYLHLLSWFMAQSHYLTHLHHLPRFIAQLHHLVHLD